jgi:N-acetylglutamate synthase-like GNAT family acetyltransferase
VHNDAILDGRKTMSDGLTLRAANKDDQAAIEALLAAEGLPPIGSDEGITHFQVLAGTSGIVAAAGLEPCGSSALLRSVVVAPACRGRGLARRLTEQLVARASALGMDALYLLTMDADAYFAGLGFARVPREQAPEEIQHTHQFREQCPDSAVLMRKGLSRSQLPQ